MKSNTIKNTTKKIGFSLLMAVGLVAFSNTEATAQYQERNNRQEQRQEQRNDRDYRNDDRDYDNDDRNYRNDNRNDRNRNDLFRVARENGFRDGKVYGRQDRRDRNRDSAQRSDEYRRAMNGFYPRLGNRNDYKNAYRQAFLEGYSQTYNRNGRGGNNRNGY